jgi:hypothetical protein
MKASFKCGVCGEKLTLTGTPYGIERARVMWLKGHDHPVAIITTGSTLTAAPVDPDDAQPSKPTQGVDS